MRIFYAIEFTQNTKKKLLEYQRILKSKSEKGNFTETDNLHLTLKFIGQTEKAEVEKYKKYLDIIRSDFEPFIIKTTGMSYFSKRYGYIVYANIARNTRLKRLQYKINRIVDPNSVNNFKPHITLARNLKLKYLNNISEIKNVECDMIEINVNKISLMESKRIDGELKYTPISSIKI